MAKKNLRKIPDLILERIRAFDQDDVVVACVKSIKPSDVPRYSHLGIEMEGDNLSVPAPSVPNPSMGKFSRANVEGLDEKRTDLPKVTKEIYCGDRPIYGDWSKGSFPLWQTRKVYQREFIPPKEVELSVTLIEEKSGAYVVRFAIEQVVNRRTENFEQELFYNLNLLQENVGAAGVFTSDTSLEDYAKTVQVDWEIFPPGTVDEVIQGVLSGKKPITKKDETTMRERVEILLELEPEAIIAGADGFLRYFGAKFGDDFVAFENVHYGNALYLMYESWEELSKKSRTELLAGNRDSFDRIEHRDGWERVLSETVSKYKEKTGI